MEGRFEEHTDILNCRYIETRPQGSLTYQCAVRVWLPEDNSIPSVSEEAMDEGELDEWTTDLGMELHE